MEGNAMNIAEVMTLNIPSISLEDDIATAAGMMRDTDSSELVVLSGTKIVGVISERDITRGCVVEGHTAWQCSVYRHMTIQDAVISPDTHIGNAAIMMIDGDLSFLPVAEDGRLLGLVSSNDIFQAVDREEISNSSYAGSMI
jgi:CBS domain-containing protein